MITVTIPFTVNIPERETPFGDDLIHKRLREACPVPAASKLLGVKIISKERDPGSRDYVMHGELTFGRWFPFPRKGRSK